ncbi:flagellar motor switch protein FliM [Asaia prunellae]|uniref:flagellar motor switch protein FliM n=1 Tax=Asaia prunellae TaxID=610245 RepID=UPI000471D726|nr:flagellar motor switch protein FliM [Asaia prunellae]
MTDKAAPFSRANGDFDREFLHASGEKGHSTDTPPDNETLHEMLDQSEIDNLLGGAFSKISERHETGMERIIRAGFVAYERMPMLEIVLDRLVRLLTTGLRNFTNDNVEITMEYTRSMCFGDYVNSVPSSSLFAVFKAVQWENFGLVVIDSALAYSVIDILMGGQRGRGHSGVEGRPHTAIERALLEKLVTLALRELSFAFGPVCEVDLVFERLEVSSRFAAIARASNAVVTSKMHIDMEDRTGNMDLVIPYATLEPVRDLLSQQFMGERFGRDSVWEDHLIAEIMETDAEILAVLEEQSIPLSRLLDIKPGMQILFPQKNKGGLPVSLQCNQTPLFEGHLGQTNGKAAVRIDQRLVPDDSPHTHNPDPSHPSD